jgi:hypothetical protein
MASQSSVVFKDDVLHLRSLERNLGKLAPAPKKKQKKKLPVADEDVDEDSDASASADGDAPKKKSDAPKKKVASCSSSSSSSDDSSQKTHKKKGEKLGGSLKCNLEQGSDCSIQSHQRHPSAGWLDAFG